jgi:hypothetical protein
VNLMVIYNESWSPFSVTNLADWSCRPWKVLARSSAGLPDWTACPDAGPTFTVHGRAMAILAASRD